MHCTTKTGRGGALVMHLHTVARLKNGRHQLPPLRTADLVTRLRRLPSGRCLCRRCSGRLLGSTHSQLRRRLQRSYFQLIVRWCEGRRNRPRDGRAGWVAPPQPRGRRTLTPRPALRARASEDAAKAGTGCGHLWWLTTRGQGWWGSVGCWRLGANRPTIARLHYFTCT